MNTETHVYNYSSSADPIVNAELTQRLYSPSSHNEYEAQSIEDEQSSSSDAMQQIFDEDKMLLKTTTSNNHAPINSHELDKAIQDYHNVQSNQLSNYLEKWLKRPLQSDHCLQIFHGWKKDHDSSSNTSSGDISSLSLGDLNPIASGGFYLRWNNTGIIINPGKNFLHHFHQAGLHIKDIDIIIVTHENTDTYADILEIYELNFRLNRASGDQQIIHYYLNQKAYRELSILLKPHSKSERNAIHCLELFAESPEIEQIKLSDAILLHYFTEPQYSASSRHQQTTQTNLGIRLELSKTHLNESSNISLGYVSGSWSPFIGQHLNNCDILLAGIGNTNQSDYNKVVHLDDSLGYYGISSLVEDTLPKLLICTEFGSRDGDLRLELIKKMRVEFKDNNSTIFIPGDIGLCIDLKTQKIKCSVTNEYVAPNQIKITRSSGLFGGIHYLAPANYL